MLFDQWIWRGGLEESRRTPGSLMPQSPHLGGLPRFFRCWYRSFPPGVLITRTLLERVLYLSRARRVNAICYNFAHDGIATGRLTDSSGAVRVSESQSLLIPFLCPYDLTYVSRVDTILT